jgi:hypothetical protein
VFKFIPNSGLKTAMQLTTGTIDRRAALFRNLVIGVVAMTVIPALWAVIQLSWMPLIGFLGIVPLCVAFLCLDIKKIDQWQVKILAAWRQGELDLDLFGQTMTTLRTLPADTLNGMLATLPTQAVSEFGKTISDDIKSIVSWSMKTINQCQFYRTAAIGMAVSLGLAALVTALILWNWYPFVVFIGSIFCIAISKWLQCFRLSRLEKTISDLENRPDQEILAEIMTQLDWGAICKKRKTKKRKKSLYIHLIV